MLSTLSTQTKKVKKSSTCQFTHSTLAPTNIDANNVPSKRQPFISIRNLNGLLSSCHLFLPTDLYQHASAQVQQLSTTKCYARVHMSLLEILTGDFFTQYIKIGDVIMRSEGRDGVDFVAKLMDGILRLEMDTPTYERCGLVGKPVLGGGDRGRTHIKARYAVEFNLRLPSMARGKKGFERLIYACKNVLNRHLTWLFMDLTEGMGSKDGPVGRSKAEPIQAYHPAWVEVEPIIKRHTNTRSPLVTADVRSTTADKRALADLDSNEELLEWFGMLAIDSPRLRGDDKIDPYLCMYCPPPSFYVADPGESSTQAGLEASQDITHLQWTAFMSPAFSTELFLLLRNLLMERYSDSASLQLDSWFAISAQTFDGKGMVTCVPGTRTTEGAMDILTWETLG